MQLHVMHIAKTTIITLITLIGLVLPTPLAADTVKTVGIFTRPLPAAPEGWKITSKSPMIGTISYLWKTTDAYKREMHMCVRYYQQSWIPGYQKAWVYNQLTFETAGRKHLAEWDKRANEKPRYKPDAKTAYFIGDSSIGPWKMRTYVLRNTINMGVDSKPLVWIVLYQPGKDAWVNIGLTSKSPSIPPNTTPEWFTAHKIHYAAQNLQDSSSDYKAWTPGKVPGSFWDRLIKRARKEGAEELAKFKDDQKKMSASYEQGHILFMKTLRAFFRSQGIEASLDPSYFRNPDPITLMRWYHWPKVTKAPVMEASPLAGNTKKPPVKIPVPVQPPADEPPVKKPVPNKPAPNQDIQAKLKTARTLLDAEKWAQTISACSRVLASDPKNATAFWYRGLACVGQKRYSLAVKQFKTVAQLQPGSEKITAYIAKVQKFADEQEITTNTLLVQASKALDDMEFDLALSKCIQALEAKPTSMVARWRKGLALVGLKRFDEAYVILDAVAKAQPDNKKARAYADKVAKAAKDSR